MAHAVIPAVRVDYMVELAVLGEVDMLGQHAVDSDAGRNEGHLHAPRLGDDDHYGRDDRDGHDDRDDRDGCDNRDDRGDLGDGDGDGRSLDDADSLDNADNLDNLDNLDSLDNLGEEIRSKRVFVGFSTMISIR